MLSRQKLKALQDVLRDDYNFTVELQLMDTVTPPQTQAFAHLGAFLHTHDTPRTLLIIYYAGHGYQTVRGTGFIGLSGMPIYHEKDMIKASIQWHEVERTLVATSSDVLVVFDCCKAGLLCKSAQGGHVNTTRTFQFIGACESEQMTKRAGAESFTLAMTWALKRLSGETSFPVTRLIQEIESHATFPHDRQRPVLFSGRFHPASENICLSRMPNQASREKSRTVSNSTTKDITSNGSELRTDLLWLFPDTNIMQSAAMLARLLRRGILGNGAVTYIANCSLELAVTQRWSDFVRTARRASRPVDHQRDVARSRSDTQNNSS